MRNRLIHAYFSVDEERLFQTTRNDLPSLSSPSSRISSPLRRRWTAMGAEIGRGRKGRRVSPGPLQDRFGAKSVARPSDERMSD